MGDTGQSGGTPSSHRPFDNAQPENRRGKSAAHISSSNPYPASGSHGGSPPFHTQLSSISSHQQMPGGQQMPNQQGMQSYSLPPSGQQHGAPFNMSGMTSALPDYGASVQTVSAPKSPYRQTMQRRSGNPRATVPHEVQQPVPYALPAVPNHQTQAVFGGIPIPMQPGYPIGYMQGYGRQFVGAGGFLDAPFLPPYPRQGGPNYNYGAGGYGGQMQPSAHGANFPPGFTGRGSFSSDQSIAPQLSDGNISTIPRGPPRKPKQSGHALWVGNLPPGANVLDLKDHFSKDAKRDIESLFLISKSNCAFVNYRTEATCAAAMQRFHDSRFQGVRLVCRLRRSSTTTPGAPVGPASTTDARRPPQPSPTKSRSGDLTDGELVDGISSSDGQLQEDTESVAPSQVTSSGSQRGAEKYFIIKSLTLQDLEQSVRNGIWATQSHNEEILNQAYESADNVYLVFSANKSGEYFGYARMISPIGDDVTGFFPASQPAHSAESLHAPRTIPTPATDTAPRGRIIDDSARGTIFWEAELTDEEDGDSEPLPSAHGEIADEPDSGNAGSQAYGKPFKIEWLSTSRLPFYRTRGLRNPWNANRDIKIARDGTELEPTVGRKLVQLFHRVAPSPISPVGAAGHMQAFMGGSSMGPPPYGL